MYVVSWEPRDGRGGGHQVALTKGRALAVQRAVILARPSMHVRVEPLAGYVAPIDEQRDRRGRDRRRRS